MDQKISQLTALTAADQADVYAIVDTSATETKKISQEDVETSIANSDNFTDALIANANFTTDLANDANFTTTLGNNANFVNTLTTNSSFQSAVNNFVTTVSSNGSSGGGKPITFSLTDTVTAASNPLSGYSDAEAVVYSNGSTIYMQDAIGYTQSRDTSTDWASSTTVVSYVLLNAYAYVLLSSGAALRVYRYNRNDLSAGGTLVTFSGATLTYGANVVMTSNGVEFFFNYNVGQSGNSYSIAKLTLSGTTLTYVSATSAGSTANQFAGAFAVDSSTNYYGTNAGIIYQYDNAGTLTVTSGSTLATISRIYNWGNTLYGCDSAGQFFNKLYMQDTDLSGGSSGVTFIATAAEDLTAGQLVGASALVDEQVAKGNVIARQVSGSISVGNTGGIKTAQIDTDKVVQVYLTGTSLNTSVVSVGTSTLSGTRGAEVLVQSDLQSSYATVCKLDTDKFIVFYVRSTSTSVIRYKIGTVSGTTITLGTEGTAFTSGSQVTNLTACQVSTDKGFFAFSGSVDSAVAFTVSGTTPTFGTSLAVDSNLLGTKACVTIATDKVALAGAFTTDGYCQIFTISGTTLTGGTAVRYTTTASSPSVVEMSITTPATDVVVIGTEDKTIAATVSGTVPTFGTEIQDAGSNPATKSVVAKSSSVIWVYYDGVARILSLSGNTLTDTGKVIVSFIGGSGYPLDLINMGSYIAAVLAGSSANASTIYIEGMSNNFIGFVQNTVSKGNTVSVLIHGVDSNQTGLTAGRIYECSSGSLSQISSNDTSYIAGRSPQLKAISSTKIII